MAKVTSAGTQSIDSRWKYLQKYIPSELKVKKGQGINPKISEYMWSWLYRHNLQANELHTALGEEFKKVA